MLRLSRLTPVLLGFALGACSSADDDTVPLAEQCDAAPVSLAPDPEVPGDYSCPTDWYHYDDRACGPPSSPGCTTFGDGRCYKPCDTDADCCGLTCDKVGLFRGSDYTSTFVNICREPS